jgi:hypothetical protein
MTRLFNKAFWIKARKSNMIAARECKAALTNPEGFWKYAPDDARVNKAVAIWVQKAWQSHEIVVNRRPVCFASTHAGEGYVYAA